MSRTSAMARVASSSASNVSIANVASISGDIGAA